MHAGRHREFASFYECYLHEDWRQEDPNSDEVIRRFVAAEGHQSAGRLLVELRSIAATDPTDEEVEQAIGPFTSFDPRDEGMAPRAWLDHMIQLLEADD